MRVACLRSIRSLTPSLDFWHAIGALCSYKFGHGLSLAKVIHLLEPGLARPWKDVEDCEYSHLRISGARVPDLTCPSLRATWSACSDWITSDPDGVCKMHSLITE